MNVQERQSCIHFTCGESQGEQALRVTLAALAAIVIATGVLGVLASRGYFIGQSFARFAVIGQQWSYLIIALGTVGLTAAVIACRLQRPQVEVMYLSLEMLDNPANYFEERAIRAEISEVVREFTDERSDRTVPNQPHPVFIATLRKALPFGYPGFPYIPGTPLLVNEIRRLLPPPVVAPVPQAAPAPAQQVGPPPVASPPGGMNVVDATRRKSKDLGTDN